MSREVSFSDIQKIWGCNKDPVMLYIHSPFCKTTCSYCVYKGIEEDGTFEDYFERHLPSEIRKYKQIIDKQNIQVIYFGGGTPNLHGVSPLIKSFEQLRDVPCKEKVIELHAGIRITNDDIDILKRYGFTTIILCVQTFNAGILDEYGRYHSDENDVKELIKKLHRFGFMVGMDMIHFCDGKNDIHILDDIKTIISFDDLPDEVTIAPLYQNKGAESYDLYMAFQHMMSKDYCCGDIDYNTYMNLNTLRFVTYEAAKKMLDGKFYSFIEFLNETGSGAYPTATLGIGSYKNPCKSTYSFTRRYTYVEQYDGSKVRYKILREMSFFDKCRKLIDEMEKATEGEDTPIGLRLCVCNNPQFASHDKDYKDHLGDIMVSINSENEDSVRYVKKLRIVCKEYINGQDI